MGGRRKFAAYFAVAFITVYSIITFTYISRLPRDEPLPRSVRWIPLASIILAMTVVAILSRNPRASVADQNVTTRVPWPINAMDRSSFALKLLIGFATIVVALPLFWLAGGVSWLDTKVFPPRRPKDMPQNAVWIDAPALPVSWHHGWWFGCDLAPSGAANYCRLVMASGEEVYAGEYLPCESKVPLPVTTKELSPPPRNVEKWIADNRLKTLAPIVALKNGDLLLPVDVLDRCDKFKQSAR